MANPKPSPKAQTAPTPSRIRPGTNLNNTTRIHSPWQRWLNRRRAGYIMVGGWAIAAALATTGQVPFAQWLERQAQTSFFHWRGPVAPPEDIVIVAIDDFSLSQGELYQEDPENLQAFALLQSWPWPRQAYAIAITKIMNAGAKVVALPLIFDSPSNYGEADDQTLEQTVAQYGDRLVLGAIYEEGQNRGGDNFRLAAPYPDLQALNSPVGFINFPLAEDGRIHNFGQGYIEAWRNHNPDLALLFEDIFNNTPSLAAATLKAAGEETAPTPSGDIFFYGSQGTFTTFSFTDIIEPQNWQSVLQNGEVFQDKIVLIGTTSPSHKDFHRTPMTEAMPGVEVHANAIASLLENKAIAPALAQPWQEGLLVLVLVLGGGLLICLPKNWLLGLGVGLSLAIAWGNASYILFVRDRTLLPTATPSLALMLAGISYSTIGAVRELQNKHHLRRTFKHYASSPIIQEIISQQDDLQDLLQEREYEMLEMTLVGRYRVVAKLSSGGFGETYIAEDSLRPGNPRCVVKKLQPKSDNPKHWQLAERLFLTEAQILERLGKHEQIPQLLAYFEEGGEFYLVEELIVGRALGDEWPIDVPLSEAEVLIFLRDFLPVLEFIHSQGAIHRDIKPDNIIRRKSDDTLVLIDFGAVKEMQSVGEEDTEKTVAIGTRGYAPKEQIAGSPRFNSDIYAVGMLAIHGLTLLHPAKLPEDPESGEIAWRDKAFVSEPLAAILDKMVKSDHRDRPSSVAAVLAELQPLLAVLPPELQKTRSRDTNSLPLDATTPWIDNTQIDSDLTEATTATTADPDADLTEATAVTTADPDADLTEATAVTTA
ncbi:MAG: serine/threonine-protein kinase, partial [Jaaginema sp. PMC 1079.18]|nr:serine/threonine-protein kinase [Jaaginema sp. PMC 1079.18]